MTLTSKGFPHTLRAKTFVVSSGGFQANIDWLKEYWGEAADNFLIRGTPYAQGRMLKNLLGQGVQQSYSNAGAWLAGKGASSEPLQPWDYSIGYAYAVLSEVLASVQYPAGALRGASEAAFVLEVDALRARQINLKPTAEGADGQTELYSTLAAAFNARLPDVVKALPSPDPKLLVNARVAMPVALRFKSAGAIDVLEDEPILR